MRMMRSSTWQSSKNRGTSLIPSGCKMVGTIEGPFTERTTTGAAGAGAAAVGERVGADGGREG